ncbi:glycoside hydrolase family 47 protein [Acidipila rosea]|uniref:Mannosidase alpha-like ER degradation enhancer 2 n=1 Tax=Acidipila rosea TaxID=768535 RepID=A0A4R1L1Q4_9BACT|nr:glycoside hydrolase family 47 protein [Acidipila rosea]TCK71885.1 mannosidase alpha-like ER degradation enhancer 2 [Acidipila rosea]
MRTLLLAVLFAMLPSAFAQQKADVPTPMTAAQKQQMADEVRRQFLLAWNGYRQYAWGHDELHPISHKPEDWYKVPLLMTPVDALDTMLVMGLDRQADEARRLIDTKLNFNQDIYVKDFEITIRLLGGLMSSYEMTGDKRLLALADELGTRMLPMFNSPTGMPYEYVNLRTGAVKGANSNPAEVGSLLLEYGTLAKLTGKQIYYKKAKRAVMELYRRRSRKTGLVGDGINVETGMWTGTSAGIRGGIDSYYEYLLKCAILFHDKDCQRMWDESKASNAKYLADQRPDGLWYGQANMNTGKRTTTDYGALDAFYPAVLALSGDVEDAARLQASSYAMWNFAGVEPDTFDYAKHKITDPAYPLRPEIIESTYYLYHYTGDAKYLAMGQTYFNALMKYCRTDVGFAALANVETKQKDDHMESFFFAETLKYMYLLFAPPSTLDFNSIVFNTEAHPLRRDMKVAAPK